MRNWQEQYGIKVLSKSTLFKWHNGENLCRVIWSNGFIDAFKCHNPIVKLKSEENR